MPSADGPRDRRYLIDLEAINPDRQRAEGGIWIEEHLGSVLWILQVHGCGAVVMRVAAVDATDETLEFKGCSMFTEDEIRWRR